MLQEVQQVLAKRDTCETGNDYNGEHWGARISAVFVVLVASAIGSFLPILSSRYSFIRMPPWCFFIFKYFGSGVIVATAFIHLLEPASDALGDECLGGTFAEYPWAFGIALMTLFALFFSELISHRYVEKLASTQAGADGLGHGHTSGNVHSHFGDPQLYTKKIESDEDEDEDKVSAEKNNAAVKAGGAGGSSSTRSGSGDHYSDDLKHGAQDQDPEVVEPTMNAKEREEYLAHLLSVFVLEFGIIFHSVFVGLSLAVSGDEFKTLYVVVVFHQMFEGLGLGTRIAAVYWPKNKRTTPWLLALGYTLCTPIAIGIGIGVRKSYPPGSRRALITNGVFDSISAGILIYTGIVELMAHEFLYAGDFKGHDGFRKMLWAYLVMCVGAGLMALLGRWA